MKNWKVERGGVNFRTNMFELKIKNCKVEFFWGDSKFWDQFFKLGIKNWKVEIFVGGRGAKFLDLYFFTQNQKVNSTPSTIWGTFQHFDNIFLLFTAAACITDLKIFDKFCRFRRFYRIQFGKLQDSKSF